MRHDIRAFVESAAECFPLVGPVYEFGSYQVEGQESVANLRPLFADQSYTGCDLRSGPGVDRIENVSRLTLPDGAAGTIICLETLEHVFEVWRAVDELIRVLAPGGVLLISIPFYFRIHAYPDDYWRITPRCLAGLLEPLAGRWVGSQGDPKRPHTVYALAAKAPLLPDFQVRAERFTQVFQAALDEISRYDEHQENWSKRISSLLGSKGERRLRRERFVSRFDNFSDTSTVADQRSSDRRTHAVTN